MHTSAREDVKTAPSIPRNHLSTRPKVLRLPVTPQKAVPSDAVLVEKARQGDSRAFGILVDRYVDVAYTIALSLLSSPADAQDTCQDAFITALERLDQCRDPSRFRAWLLQIVRNRAHNIRRFRGVRSEVDLDTITPLRSDSNPALETERAELRDQILAALPKLTELQRQVLMLFDLEGWTHHDISEDLGISEGASRAALFKGRTALRRLLAGITGTDATND